MADTIARSWYCPGCHCTWQGGDRICGACGTYGTGSTERQEENERTDAQAAYEAQIEQELTELNRCAGEAETVRRDAHDKPRVSLPALGTRELIALELDEFTRTVKRLADTCAAELAEIEAQRDELLAALKEMVKTCDHILDCTRRGKRESLPPELFGSGTRAVAAINRAEGKESEKLENIENSGRIEDVGNVESPVLNGDR